MSYVDALQTTLASEHAAVFVHGALGAQTSRSGEPALYAAIESAYADHRSRRDQLVTMIRDAGGEPIAAEPAYALPPDLGTPDLVSRRALRLEKSCAETYAYLVANSPQDRRRWAINALTQTAVRELAFRGTPEI
ncbi:MAG: ferritin-like domain-containing protein, partial [Actinomycetota bacterium]|nr:ferritin-like domain-containing protein [Actinomycetota bacterium]